MKITKKTKILSVAAALLVFGSANAFGFGVGLQAGGGYANISGGDYGFALLISASKEKHFALALNLNNNYKIGGTIDWWLFQPEITKAGPGSLKFFLGPGIGVNVSFSSNEFHYLGAGLRLPIGLDYDLSKFDVFLQIVPNLGMSINPNDNELFKIPTLGVDAALGFRFWVS